MVVSSLQSQAERVIFSFPTLKAIPVVKFDGHIYQAVILSSHNDEDWLNEYDKASNGTADTDVTLEDEVLWYLGKLWVPNSVDLWKMILQEEHDSKGAGDMGPEKTIELVSRNFFWPQMDQWIEDYVRSCPDCHMNKSAHHKCYKLLQPLELAYRPWDEVSMDFIVDISVSNGGSSIWAVVDRFMKMSHCVNLMDGEKKAPDLVRIFQREMWRHHAIPSTITSDRDTRFTSMIWKGSLDTLGIKSKMPSPFHPQTDGQMERMNQTLECYLWNYCDYEQDNWEEMLPMSEHTYNNSLHSTVKMTLFFANYGYHPQTNWPTSEPSSNPTSQSHIEWTTSVRLLCRQGLEKASEMMRKYHHKNANAAPVYQLGNMVMPNGKTLKTRRPASKFDPKLHGPFEVMKVMTPIAPTLELHWWWRMHHGFNVWLIEPSRICSNPIRDPPDRDAMVTNEHHLGYDVEGDGSPAGYEVDKIMGS